MMRLIAALDPLCHYSDIQRATRVTELRIADLNTRFDETDSRQCVQGSNRLLWFGTAYKQGPDPEEVHIATDIDVPLLQATK
jgi:hypothetical protein